MAAKTWNDGSQLVLLSRDSGETWNSSGMSQIQMGDLFRIIRANGVAGPLLKATRDADHLRDDAWGVNCEEQKAPGRPLE